MDWNSCLTIGLGEGVGVALRRSGVLEGSRVRLVECVLGGLRFLSQVMVSIWVFPKIVGKFPPNHPSLIGISIIFTIHFGGFPPIFWKQPYIF